jgi:hypothetical protein
MDTSPRARPDEPQAFCSGCGLALEESDALPYESRKPCPNCGGLARTFPASSKIAISSELRASGTLIHVLDSASKYYSEILKPEHDEFFAARSTLRSAFNLATNLFHFHEWLFDSHRVQLEAYFGKTLETAGAFWAEVERVDSRFGFIRDLSNSSKHVRLTRRPSTSMTHVANTFVEVGAFDSAAFDRSAFDTARVKMKDGPANVEFDDCARALFRYWTDLSGKLGVIA